SEEGSAASTAVGEDMVLAAAPDGILKRTPETVEDGASDFAVLERAVVPGPTSVNVDAGASMGDEGSVVNPAAEALNDVPLAPDSETVHKEEEPAVGHEGIPVHEAIDGVDNLGAGVEKAVLVNTADAPTAAFDAALPNETHRERVPSSTTTWTPTAE
ncbi:unnamed protein product, partial [Laminaria digitata]